MKYEEKIMSLLGSFVNRFYGWILVGSVVLFFLSMVAASRIEQKTEMKDMLPENNPKIQAYSEIDEIFAGGSSVIILIEGEEKQKLEECAVSYVDKIRNNPVIMSNTRAINDKVDKDFIEKWALIFAKAKDLEKVQDQYKNLNLVPYLTAVNDMFEATYTGDEADEDIETRRQEQEAVGMFDQMGSAMDKLRTFLEGQNGTTPAEAGKDLADTFTFGNTYNYSPDNKLLMFSFSPSFNAIDFTMIKMYMAEVKKIHSAVQAEFPELEIGYTGDIPIQSDEQDAASFDMMVPALVALVIILILFIFTFKSISSIILALVTLIFGIVYMFGGIGIFIGEMNMLTNMMAVLLLGLGIDYGIQIITNYNTFRGDGYSPKDAVSNTFMKAGMGTTLAALTTAVAFLVLSFTGSTAFQQFGMVMALGIVSCFSAMLILLPSALLSYEWWSKLLKGAAASSKIFKVLGMIMMLLAAVVFLPVTILILLKKYVFKIQSLEYNFLPALASKLSSRRKATLIITGAITVCLLLAAVFMNEMEYDMMKMEPDDMPSILGYQKVMDKFELTPFQSMYIASSIEEARDITKKLEKQTLIRDVDSISYLIPTDKEQTARLKMIKKIRNMPARYNQRTYTKADMLKLAEQVQRLEWNIIETADLSVAGLGEDNQILKKRDMMIREIMGAETGKAGDEVFQKLITAIKNDPGKAAKAFTTLDRHFAKAMDNTVSRMASLDENITPKALPRDIYQRYFDKTGTKNLVSIFPPTGLYKDLNNMKRFNNKCEKIDPRITGTPQITIEWLDEFITATYRATAFIFLAVIIFIMITFRNFRYTVIAAIPLAAGMIWMLGIYPLMGLKLNLMNFMVIPLVIGMGIDFGIHIVHRFRVEDDISHTYRYTGKAVFLSAMTTMIGFGSLGLVGRFPSISSMGTILFLGITTCLLATLAILPALLGSGQKVK